MYHILEAKARMFNEHRPFVFLSLIVLALMIILALGASRLVSAQVGQPPISSSSTTTVGDNLLLNPNFDEAGYYFRFPNSLVAPQWYRWYVSPGAIIPEHIDGGTPHHNACYPEPPPGGLCVEMTPKNRSQGYIKYGGTYIAGVLQPVHVTPCLDYQFAGYVRTDDAGYRPKVGIEPTGWWLPPKNKPDPRWDYDCPPDGQTLCPKESFTNESDMPASIVWSPPYPYDPPTPPIYWRGPISVTTEALSTTITVWTYAAPSVEGSQSTYWDVMSLYQVPRQTPLAPDGEVLVPDMSLNPTVITGTTTQIQWATDQPAFSQVYYRLHSSSPISPTALLSNTVYLPVATNGGYVSTNDFTYNTAPTSEMATSHSATLSALQSGATYDYMIAVRSFDGSTCATTGSLIGTFTAP